MAICTSKRSPHYPTADPTIAAAAAGRARATRGTWRANLVTVSPESAGAAAEDTRDTPDRATRSDGAAAARRPVSRARRGRPLWLECCNWGVRWGSPRRPRHRKCQRAAAPGGESVSWRQRDTRMCRASECGCKKGGNVRWTLEGL